MTDAPLTRAEAVTEERRQRERPTGIGSQGDPTLRRFGITPDVLDHNKYIYRAALDDGSRLYELVDQGEYEFVTLNDKKTGHSLKADAPGAIKYRSGTKVDGSPAWSYLLRKLKKFADEDRAEAVKQIDEQERAQLQGRTKDAPDKSYTPKR